MADYPDYTELMQIIGSDIMVPIDVQGAYIMMPVDIQAQYLTLEIDIVAQSVGNIEVDLVAQSVGAISVDITAQTIAQLDINIDAQNVGVYLQPEWAALTGVDLNFSGLSTDCDAATFYAIITYTVTAGKTLYISHFGAAATSLAANVACYLFNVTDNITVAVAGGVQGFIAPLNKPIAVASAHQIKLYAAHFGAAVSNVRAHIGSYEI